VVPYEPSTYFENLLNDQKGALTNINDTFTERRNGAAWLTEFGIASSCRRSLMVYRSIPRMFALPPIGDIPARKIIRSPGQRAAEPTAEYQGPELCTRPSKNSVVALLYIAGRSQGA